jgi:GGDEF domain-containing protein
LAITSTFVILILAAGAVIGALLVYLRAARRDESDAYGIREAIPSFRRSHSRLEIELSRVRRYDHPLALMVVRIPRYDIDGPHAEVFAEVGNSARERHVRRIVSLHVGALLYDCLRSSDLPTWDAENDRYIVVLPESDRAHAGQAADRLRRLVPSHIGAPIAVGVAEFPSDGLALEDLVTLAAQRCAPQTENAGESEYAAVEDAASLGMVESNVVERNAMDRHAQSG